MPSSAVAGFKGYIQVSTDSGSTWSAISEQKAGTLRVSQDKVETTNKGTSVSGSMVQKERLVVAGRKFAVHRELVFFYGKLVNQNAVSVTAAGAFCVWI